MPGPRTCIRRSARRSRGRWVASARSRLQRQPRSRELSVPLRARGSSRAVRIRRTSNLWQVALSIAVATQTPLIGQSPTPAVAPSGLVKAPTIQPPPAGEIEILPVRGNIYALMGAGANIIASVGPDGVLLVDAGTAGMTDKIVAALAQLQREFSARNEPKPLGW